MKKILFLIILLSIYSCDPGTESYDTNIADGKACQFDLNCKDTSVCKDGFCIAITDLKDKDQRTICLNSSQCTEPENKCEGLPCLCSNGFCKSYDPCEANPCDLQYKETDYRAVCEIKDDSFQCLCNDKYIDVNGECKVNCGIFGTPASDNIHCDCNPNYKEEDYKCIYDCSAIPFSKPNAANTGCDCNQNYDRVGNTCVLNCSSKLHSHRNDENDYCDCDEGYLDIIDSNVCCPNNSTYQNGSCKCVTGFHQEGQFCVDDTPCNPNSCTRPFETVCSILSDPQNVTEYVEDVHYDCSCNNGYHEDNGICCAQYFSNVNGICVSDYDYCGNDGECTGGQICNVNSIDATLKSYCENPQEDKVKPVFYCTQNEDCLSGLCKTDTDGNGYCVQLCEESSDTHTLCDAPDCLIEGTSNLGNCSVDNTLGFPYAKCVCPQGYAVQGPNCIQMAGNRGESCGGQPEIVITSSGVYTGDTRSYLNNNTVSTCQPSANGNDIIYKMVLSQTTTVTLELLKETGLNLDDSVLYVKTSCESPTDIACNDDKASTDRLSKISKVFDAGTYYVFVDGYSGESGTFKLAVNISPFSCPTGTTCLNETVSLDNLSDDFRVCKPSNDITRCDIKTDCETGKDCSFIGNDMDSIYLGCSSIPGCIADYVKYPGSGPFCCSGLQNSSTNECRSFCQESLDCRVGYDCNAFSVTVSNGTYNSAVDGYKLCLERSGTTLCSKDAVCSGSTPYCMVDDNLDNRLLTKCKAKRSGFDTANIGANCSSGAYKNCYNNICYIPNLEGNNNTITQTPYCTNTCSATSDCSNGYECSTGNIMYPLLAFATTAVCKLDNRDNCVTDDLNVCVQTKKTCADYSECGGNSCKIALSNNGLSHYFYCETPVGVKLDGESCSNATECKSGFCYSRDITANTTIGKICMSPCSEAEGTSCYDSSMPETETFKCSTQYVRFSAVTSQQKVCHPAICTSDSDCTNGEVCLTALNNNNQTYKFCGTNP